MRFLRALFFATLVWLAAGTSFCPAMHGQNNGPVQGGGNQGTQQAGNNGGGQMQPAGVQAAPPSGDVPGGGYWRSDAYYREQAAKRASGSRSKPAPATAPPSEPDFPETAPTGPMSAADTRLNFTTVVQAYLDARSPDGYWKVSDPKTKRLLRLKFARLDKAPLSGGARARVHAGRVWMRAAGRKALIPVYFTVDFSGVEWKVVKYGFASAEKSRARRRKIAKKTKR